MAKEFAKSFYNSSAWIKTRKAYIEKCYGLCEKCKQPGLILHHIVHLTPQNITDENISLDFNNLMFLCHDCHNNVHGYYTKTEGNDEAQFDKNGNFLGLKQDNMPPF